MPPGEGAESPPVPDPTILTTEQLLREIATLKELFSTSLDGHNMVNVQRFLNVETQLNQAERQRVEQKQDTKAAVDAALAAAKEAVGKSETSTKEQLTQLSTTFTTAQSAMTQSVVGLTTRVERIENARTTIAEQKTDTRAGTGTMIAIGALVVGALSFVMTIILTVTRL